MSEFDAEAVAREIKAAQDSRRQIEPFTSRMPGFDLVAGYAVMRALNRARVAEGWKPAGRKIGYTNPGVWAAQGVSDPIWAYVYDSTVEYGESGRIRCSVAPFTDPRLEPEIVVRLGAAPRPGAGAEEILGAIEWIANGFEIVTMRYSGWKPQPADTLADGAVHGALLVGPRRAVKDLGEGVARALEAFELTLSRDGAAIETGTGANVLGSPLLALARVVSVLARQSASEPLRAGEIVTTGTITAAQAVRAGETWRSEVRGIALPGLTLELTA